MNLSEMKSKHKLLKDYSYELGEIEKGYTNRTLHVNLSNNEIKEKPVTQLMKDKFVGGKGLRRSAFLYSGIASSYRWVNLRICPRT